MVVHWFVLVTKAKRNFDCFVSRVIRYGFVWRFAVDYLSCVDAAKAMGVSVPDCI